VENKLTVIIPCKNEEHNIRPSIESARAVADEVIVADSGSTDRTLDIVQQVGGCRVIQREYVRSANFKNWAIPQAAHPWVLILDADERVSDELADEVRAVLSGTLEFDGYRIRFQPYFLGCRIKHSGWNSSSGIRLFRRDVSRYADQHVHADVEVSTGKVGRLRGKFLHFTCRSLSQFVEKQNRYASWSAEDMYAKGRRVGYLGLLLRPPARFLQFYFLRGGFLDGRAGLAVCMTVAFYTFMKYTKLWELCAAGADAAPETEAGSSNEMKKAA